MAKAPKPMRNWAACDPLMRKGGAHQDAKLTHRPRLDRRQALDEFEDWQDELSGGEQQENHEGPKGPFFLPQPMQPSSVNFTLATAPYRSA